MNFRKLCYNRKRQNSEDNKKAVQKVMPREVTSWLSVLLALRYMQRQGQIWIRIFPDKPITRKPADVRMGKGKGAPEGFVAPVTPGRIIIEAEGVSYEIAKEALRLAAQKLPITTKFVVRRDYDIQNQNA